MGNLTGKVAIVTGAAAMRGMGRAIARRMAEDGADVAVVDLPKPVHDFPPGWNGLESVVEEISAAGRRGLAVNANVGDSIEVEDLVRRVRSELGRIDFLVNCAAVRMNPTNTLTVDIEETDWERVIRINLTAPFLLSKAAAKVMIEQGTGGKIVNIASVGGKRPLVGMAAYCSAKAGLINLTAVMALELAPHNIQVNAVCPGSILTDYSYAYRERLMREKGFGSMEEASEWSRKNVFAGSPLGRQGTVEEIAATVAFLVSPESDFIDGQAINVCGATVIER